jgi:hypothetical protein
MSETTEAAAPEAGTAEDARAAAAAEMVDDNAPVEDAEPAAVETEQPEAEETPEEVELSFGAKTLKVRKDAIPEDVLAALDDFTKNVQGDYTRKTQEAAEVRKAAEAQRELAEKLVSLKGDALKAYARGQSLADEIQQLEAVNLPELWQSNPDHARWISDTISAKRAEFQRAVEAVAHHEHAMTAEQERAAATLMEAGRAEMKRAVKGFDDKAEAALIEYAVKEYGIPEQEARKWPLNPKTAAMAWKAMQFDKLQAQTKAAAAPKAPAAPAAPVKATKPLTGGNSTRDLEHLAATNMEAFARERARQDAARRR